jgi:Flp pilus assembly protein TadD
MQAATWKDSQTLWTRALACTTDNYVAHFKLGVLFLQKEEFDQAISHFQNAVRIRPGYAKAHNDLGGALLHEGKLDEAIFHLQRALQLNPGYGQAENNLANALLQQGRIDEAIGHFQRALQLEPANPGIMNILSWLLAVSPQPSLRDGSKAVDLALRANALTGGANPAILHTLAAAYAEAGRFSEAVDTAQSAMHLAAAQSNTGLARRLQMELNFYHAARPFHLPEQSH